MHVYLMSQVGYADFVKIGSATVPQTRLIALQQVTPNRLSLIATFKCRDIQHAQYVEKQAHEFFKDSRRFGEWFLVGSKIDEVKAKIVEIAAKSAHRFEPRTQPKPELPWAHVLTFDREMLLNALSPRELQVLEYFADGLTTAEAAKAMRRSMKTVSTYTVRIAVKLGMEKPSHVKLAAVALIHGAQPKVSAA
jgi:DNA-binding NarL/FixJ family response regulator